MAVVCGKVWSVIQCGLWYMRSSDYRGPDPLSWRPHTRTGLTDPSLPLTKMPENIQTNCRLPPSLTGGCQKNCGPGEEGSRPWQCGAPDSGSVGGTRPWQCGSQWQLHGVASRLLLKIMSRNSWTLVRVYNRGTARKTWRGRPRWLKTLHRLHPPLCNKKIHLQKSFQGQVTHDTWHITHDRWEDVNLFSFLALTLWQLQVTCDTWHVTCDPWHMTCDTWLMTGDIWHVVRGEHSIKISVS